MPSSTISVPFSRAVRLLGIFLCVGFLRTSAAHDAQNAQTGATPSPAGSYGLIYGLELSPWAPIVCGVGVVFLLACRPHRHG